VSLETNPKIPKDAPGILIIDDSPVACEVMSQILHRAGFRVHAMTSPLGATREVIRRKVAIVLLDLNMPAMRGDRLASLFRSNSRLKELSLVLVSSEPESQVKELAKTVGADAVVPKSKVEILLLPTVRELMKKHICRE